MKGTWGFVERAPGWKSREFSSNFNFVPNQSFYLGKAT